MKVKREKSTEQRLRCPVLFSHAWGEAPSGGREGEVARPLGLSRRMAETWCTNHCKALIFRFLCTKFQAIFKGLGRNPVAEM